MERALLVTVDTAEPGGWTPPERALELAELASSAGAKAVHSEIVRRHRIDPAYFIGSGKAEELAQIAADKNINIAIFNNDLSGSQQKNLEETIKKKTIDRTQLILDIFARHAHSNEGKIQVELAQLMYLLPRLTGKGIYLSRLGGGIGTRGPGETKLEVDRRRIRSRIFRLKKDLEDLSSRRAMMRKKRGRFSLLALAIIGYTNVGKSTLLNALTSSDVIVEDKLFSTLDPTVRKFMMPNRQKVLFIDTVGFLDKLPHHLIEAFKATLEEVVEADIIIHVVDISHPKAVVQAESVYRVLEEIGARDKPVITVLNKIDKADPTAAKRIQAAFDDAITISALTKEGFGELIAAILPYVERFMSEVELKIPLKDAGTVSFIHESGLVTEKRYTADAVYLNARLPSKIKDMLDPSIILRVKC